MSSDVSYVFIVWWVDFARTDQRYADNVNGETRVTNESKRGRINSQKKRWRVRKDHEYGPMCWNLAVVARDGSPTEERCAWVGVVTWRGVRSPRWERTTSSHERVTSQVMVVGIGKCNGIEVRRFVLS